MRRNRHIASATAVNDVAARKSLIFSPSRTGIRLGNVFRMSSSVRNPSKASITTSAPLTSFFSTVCTMHAPFQLHSQHLVRHGTGGEIVEARQESGGPGQWRR